MGQFPKMNSQAEILYTKQYVSLIGIRLPYKTYSVYIVNLKILSELKSNSNKFSFMFS